MNDSSVLIETDRALLELQHICETYTQPEFSVYLHKQGPVYRSEESRHDLDVLIAFRDEKKVDNFARHEYFVEQKNLQVKNLTLRAIASKVSKETLVVIDPEVDDGLVYDSSFFINPNPSRGKNF